VLLLNFQVDAILNRTLLFTHSHVFLIQPYGTQSKEESRKKESSFSGAREKRSRAQSGL
jgi:hypothetical protein